MKKFFSLVLALVMALSLTTVAWGASVADCPGGCAHEAAIGTTHYDTLEEAIAAVPSANIVSGATLPDATTITLLTNANAGFNVGTTTGKAAKNIVLDLAGKTLTLDQPVGSSGTETNGFRVHVYSCMEIKDGSIVCDDVAMVKNGAVNYGTLTLTNVDFDAGANVLSTIRNCGDLTLAGTTSVENGEAGEKLAILQGLYWRIYDDFDASINVSSDDVVVGAVGVERSANAQNVGGDIVVNISAGSFESVTDVTDPAETDVADTVGNITGGTFGSDVPDTFVADGYELLANGTVVTTPAASATNSVLYVADNSTAGWATYYIATGADLDDLKQGADENCLPCYLIDGDYYTEVSPAIAAYKLVYGAKTVYLNPVDSTDVCYDAEASLFTNVTKKADQCGKLVVTDTTKTYYVFYDELDDDEDYYFVATKNGSIQLLVGAKIVDVELHTMQALTAHKWVGYDVVNNAYTTIKCENCEKVAKLYANKTAAGKNAVYVDDYGWITATSAALPSAVVPSAPSTDKVTSAETFDAGIALYVGMSVMAATGAVVLKKRED